MLIPTLPIALGAGQVPTAMPEERERAAVYQWLDSICPAMKTAPLVRVKTFSPDQAGNFGLLVSHDAKSVRVTSFDLFTQNYLPKSQYLVDDFDRWLERNSRRLIDRNPGMGYLDDVFSRTVISWLAASRGHAAEAKGIFHVVYPGPHVNLRGRGSIEPSLLAYLKDEYADRLHRQIEGDLEGSFEEYIVPRSQLYAETQTYLSMFPNGEDRQEIAEFASTLKEQLAEDAVHRKPNATHATKQEMIQEWVYELRDISGGSISNPGGDDYFHSVCVQNLIKQGFAAVPQLIRAIEDKGYTRARGSGMGLLPENRLRVQDAALAVLGRIAGKNFGSDGMYALADFQVQQSKADVLAWWRKANGRRDTDVLEDEIRHGAADLNNASERLFALAPGRLVSALGEGFTHVPPGVYPGRAFSVLGKLGTVDARNLIRAQAKGGVTQEVRCNAAEELQSFDPGAANDALIKDLEGSWRNPDSLEPLMFFFEQAGDANSIKKMHAILPNFDSAHRAQILDCAGSRWGMGRPLPPNDSKALHREIESLLGDELSDLTVVLESANYNGHSFSNPRLADVAGYFLARSAGKPYRYPDEPGQTYESIRQANLATWQKRHAKGL